MSSTIDQKTTEPFQLPPAATWAESVELFQAEAADWLTAADAPQLMALRSIAKQLDGGSFQAALISQFTLVHRGLLARRPGEPNPGGDGAGGSPQPPGQSMFEIFGGKPWTADS